MNKITKFLSVGVLALPFTTYAANVTDIEGLIAYAIKILNLLVPFIVGLAVIGFLWGVMKYIFAADTKSISEARNYMIFGIIGIAVMLSVWGLAFFVKNSFFTGAATPGGSRGEQEGGNGPACPFGDTTC